jgi:RNA polymerase sigma factor (sigma-70 family)
MSQVKPQSALRSVRNLFQGGVVAGLSDAQLLERFAARRAEKVEAAMAAEAAFAALVDRHGPMVWGVCRLILGNVHEAEDAFQATFLILVRKAGSVRVDDSLGRWLHQVARRVALRARGRAARKPTDPGKPGEVAGLDPAQKVIQDDLRAVLEEELRRLQPKYRVPIELCHLQGLTHDQAADRLGWPVGTVRSRLAGGRERLRMRLVRRGLAPAAGGLATLLGGKSQAALSKTLLSSTVRAACQTAADAAGSFPAPVVALAQETMRAMFLNKFTVATAIALLGILGTRAAVFSYQDAPSTSSISAGTSSASASSTPSAEGVQVGSTSTLTKGDGVASFTTSASQAGAEPAGNATSAAVPAGGLPPRGPPPQGATATFGVMTGGARLARADASEFRAQVDQLARMIQKLQEKHRYAEAAEVARQLSRIVSSWEMSLVYANVPNRQAEAQAEELKAARLSGAAATAPRGVQTLSRSRTVTPEQAGAPIDHEMRLQRIEATLEQILQQLKQKPAGAGEPRRD